LRRLVPECHCAKAPFAYHDVRAAKGKLFHAICLNS
jgi:hypothetical protein